jgi:ubiquinone biosynthesis protein COQ9
VPAIRLNPVPPLLTTGSLALPRTIPLPKYTRCSACPTMSIAASPSAVLLSASRASLAASSLASTRLKRTYFSVHHPDPPSFSETQERILSAAISRVPEHGFTQRALVLGAKDAGYLDATVQLFPRGVFELINYHLVTQRLGLKHNVQFPEEGRLSLGAKVKTLAMARLRANTDIIRHWQGVWSPVSQSNCGS